MGKNKLLWLADLHLDLAEDEDINSLFERIVAKEADALLLTGDICDGALFGDWIEKIQKRAGIPLFFVLGNHDYFGSSIAATRKMANQLSYHCHYLTSRDFIDLTDNVALVGHDGWADGRYGNFITSSITLRDYTEVEDLKGLSPQEQLERLNELGGDAAAHLEENLQAAFKEVQKVILLIHPPPFPEACLYNNSVADDEWGPHFICRAVGDMLKETMASLTDKEVLVLCGHAHHASDVRILPNLRVLTGGYEKGIPRIEKTLIL